MFWSRRKSATTCSGPRQTGGHDDDGQRQARVRAPELHGAGGWIGTGGQELTLAGLRGEVVLLDSWTFCCVNCLHVLDELRPLEQRFADVLVVVGVHSPKFAHEADHDAVVAAVERYEVHHAVLDDPELRTWSQYAVRAWPTLCVVDPEGYLVRVASGEGHADGLGRLVQELVAEHEAKGTLHRGDGPYVPPPPAATELLFPGKALLLPDGDLLVTDTAHHSVVRLAPDGETLLRRYGTGRRGLVDGAAPQFAEPQGLALLEDGSVLVADSANHVLRRLDVQSGQVVALFQHPLGVTVLPDGSLAVCDTYTDAVRRYDPATGEVTTLATGVREPSGAVVVDGDLVVVASAAHRLERPVAPGLVQRVQGAAQRTQRPSQDVAPGEVSLEVVFVPPTGQEADDRHVTQQDWGIPVRVVPGAPARVAMVLNGLDV